MDGNSFFANKSRLLMNLYSLGNDTHGYEYYAGYYLNELLYINDYFS